jgi:hypothetical protein
MKMTTALQVLQSVNYDIEQLNRFVNVKQVCVDELMGEKTVVFNDNSYITIKNNDSVYHGTHHDDIGLNDCVSTAYVY